MITLPGATRRSPLTRLVSASEPTCKVARADADPGLRHSSHRRAVRLNSLRINADSFCDRTHHFRFASAPGRGAGCHRTFTGETAPHAPNADNQACATLLGR